jgi:hypothetical protein
MTYRRRVFPPATELGHSFIIELLADNSTICLATGGQIISTTTFTPETALEVAEFLIHLVKTGEKS